MFDFETFEKELDEQNAALESLLADIPDDVSVAEEGLFNPKSMDKLLQKVQKQVDKKCTTVDACNDMLARLTNEESKFNAALQTMKEAAKKYNEDGDKAALKAAIKPVSKDLKKTCNIISLKEMVPSENEVNDEDIQKLHDFLVGARGIITNKLNSLELVKEGYDMTADALFNAMESDILLDTGYTAVLEAEKKSLKDRAASVWKSIKFWFTKMIGKFSRKEKEEKDPKKKNIFKKIVGIFKKGDSQLNSAKDDVEKMKSIKDMTQEDYTKLHDQVYGTMGVSDESFFDDPYEKMIDAAFEAYYEAKADYDSALEAAMGIDPLQSGLELAEEGLKDSLVSAKDNVKAFIDKQIAKFSKKEKTESDPEEKKKDSKILAKLKALGSKIKGAKNKDEVEEVNEEAKDVVTEAMGWDALEGDPYVAMVDAAFEAYELAKGEYQSALESVIYSNDSVDDYGIDFSVVTEADDAKKGHLLDGLKRKMAMACHKMAAFCKRHIKEGKDKGFWVSMNKWFTNAETKLSSKLSEEQTKKLNESIQAYTKKCEDKANAKVNTGGYVQDGEVYSNTEESYFCMECLDDLERATEAYDMAVFDLEMAL